MSYLFLDELNAAAAAAASGRPLANLECPEPHRALVQRVIDCMPQGHWRLPATGDVMENLDAFEAHIRAFSFCEGFDVVKEGGGSALFPGIRLQCIHHGVKTQNNRALEDRVAYNEDGEIVSLRKLDNTQVKQLGCPWKVRCTWKDQHRGRKDTAWIVKVVNSSHSHALQANPLIYLAHLQATPEYKFQASAARHQRTKTIPYSMARRILEDEDFGMLISPSDYYNSVRNQSADKGEYKSIAGLVVALQQAGFVYRTRVKVTYEGEGEGEVAVARQLTQLWFAHLIQLQMARRFVSGFSLIIDGTFNTNSLRLPLLVAVGSQNTGASFPVFFSFCPSEDRESFDFCRQSFKEECLRRPGEEVAADPGVIIADWAPGLITAHAEAWPNTSLQGCDWHAAGAMMKWFREKKYSHAFLEGEYVVALDDSGKKVYVEGLKSYIWRYIKSANLPDLDDNRQALINLLKDEHRYYILTHWKPLEPRFIHAYVLYQPNLGSTSSQKVESYHPVVRTFTNAQLSLEKSVAALIKAIQTWARTTGSEEADSSRAYPRLFQTADDEAFALLKTKISLFAAKKIEKEWHEMSVILRADPENDLGVCRCILLIAFALPCRHYLRRAYMTGQPVPRSLVHRRWWLGITDEVNPSQKWVPMYPDQAAARYSGSDDVVQRSIQLNEIRSLLAPEESSRFRAQELRLQSQVQNQLLSAAQSHLLLQNLPVGLPNANPRHLGRRQRSGRIETGPEKVAREAAAAVRLKASEAAQAQALRLAQLPILPPPPPRPTTPPQPAKRDREAAQTPGKPPTPARAAPAMREIEEEVDSIGPPPSTAPAAVGRRSGRQGQGRGWESLVPKGRGRGKK